MAVASLVISLIAIPGLCGWWIGGLLGVLGAIFGHVARRRIKRSGTGGGGMALAGIIIGWVVSAIAIIGAIVFVAILAADDSGTSTF
ncbi:DUF4190 domain-containing protein [Pseudosporangium ferrugineum]|nr:DUF4190 domain-containing protein [Pseudosporangium ferrugineum]